MAKISAYSRLDQTVHKLAFSGGLAQTAADIEDSLYKKRFQDIPVRAPIFITSLPRAGTTILLTAMAHLPHLATHLYRDMPFLMAPMLWSKLSGGFRKDTTMGERAHGDGIKVGYDSPEAFEEVIWKAFWTNHFTDSHIALGKATHRSEAGEAFLRRHIQKIIALRCPEAPQDGRYISKNNANISRLPLLFEIFPDAKIIVPVRDPLTHAASLLRQHQNFLKQHAEDAFVRRYMEDIGHFEFGALHRPIRFPESDAALAGLDAETLDYWLTYWVSAFTYLKDSFADDARVHFVSHEGICQPGNPGLVEMLTFAELEAGPHMTEIAGEFRDVPARAIDLPHDAGLLATARDLYANLTRMEV